MLSRLIWGGRVSLLVGFVPVALATGVGLLLGLLAGYAGGILDQIIMRTLDVLFAFPMVLLAIAIAGVLTPGIATEIIAITIVLIPYVGRLARTATLVGHGHAVHRGGARRGRIPHRSAPALHHAERPARTARLCDHAHRAR